MSDTNDSGQSAPASSAGGGKQRSPVERAIVWGMIGILLVVVAIEAHARLSHSMTMSALQDMVIQGESGVEYLTLSTVRESIVGFPSEVGLESNQASGGIRLSWFSLLKTYELDLEIETGEEDPMFLGYSTPGMPMDEFPVVAPPTDVEPSPGVEPLPDDGPPTGAEPPTDVEPPVEDEPPTEAVEPSAE